MKSHSIIFLFLVSVLTFSCTDDLINIGSGIQPKSDEIAVATDTFHVATENVFVDSVSLTQNPDSFLLGTFYDEKYGTTQADILAQVKAPIGIGFKYPVGSVPISACVELYYSTWFGDSNSPLDVNVYEMNKKTFDYSAAYKTNIDPTEYTDRSLKLGQRIFSAKDTLRYGTKYTSCVKIMLSNDFVQRFSLADDHFATNSAFSDFFGGMYITANFGAATMLNVRKIKLKYYYQYKKEGADTVNLDSVVFSANMEVRQVNRFVHPNVEKVKQILAQKDSVNYISSPYNIQTKVRIPLKRIQHKMDSALLNKTTQTFNSVLMNVEATEEDDATLAQPIVKYMLLIKESEIDKFFKNRTLPSDTSTCAVIAIYTSSQIGTTGVYKHYYTFNIASLIKNELKIAKNNNTDPAENMDMRLIPVRVAFDSSGSVTLVKQQFLMSGVTIRSGKNTYSPMRINMIYSGF